MQLSGEIDDKNSTLRVRHAGLLISLAVLLAYSSSLGGAFQFDDFPAIVENPTLRHLWPISGPLTPPIGGLTVSGRPILNLSFAVNYAISGAHVWSYHILNLLIHLSGALILFGIVRRTLMRMQRPFALETAWAAAIAWGVHPLTTESVTYIVQRAESLTGMLLFACLYGFIRMTEPKPEQSSPVFWGIFSWVACLLGTGTKEVSAAIPVIVLLYDRTFVAKSWEGLARRRRYHFAMAGTWVVLVLLVRSNGWDRGATSGFGVGVAWVPYWLSQGEALARYLWLSLLPYSLAFDYGLPSAPYWLAIVLSCLVLGAVLACLIGCLRGRPWGFLLGSALAILAPTSLLPGVLQFASEHRMYIPLAGMIVGLAVWSIPTICRSPSRPRRTWLVLGLAIVVAGLANATFARNRLYASDLALWADTVAKRPASATAQANLGQALLLRNRLDEALPHCFLAVQLNPALPTARYNLGLAYEAQEKWANALGEYVVACTLNPKLFYAQFRAGRICDRLGRFADAESHLRAALMESPEFGECHASLAVAEAGLGHPDEAVEEAHKALAYDPKQPEVEYNLAVVLAHTGQADEALRHFEAAAKLKPDYWQAQLNAGVTLAQQGRLAEAESMLGSAAKASPMVPELHATLAIVEDQSGRPGEAIAEYRNALRLKPDYAEAHYNLGNALLRARDLVGARTEFLEAVRLNPGFAQAREMVDRIDAFSRSP